MILISQLRIWRKQTNAFFHTLAAVNNLNTSFYVIQSQKYKKTRAMLVAKQRVGLPFGLSVDYKIDQWVSIKIVLHVQTTFYPVTS